MASAQPAAGSAASATHPYTCNTCHIAYRNIDLQKTHMKSDWHRYNLKRRVASLPPITAEVFAEKVLQARAETTAEADKAYFERACDACTKTYYSENAYQNHLLSQKHKQNELNAGKRQDDETTSVMSSTFSLGEPASVSKKDVDSDAEDEFNQVIEGLQKASVTEQRPSPVKRPSNPHHATEDEKDDRDSQSATPVQSSAEPVWTLQSCIFCNYVSPTLPLNTHHMERFHGMFIPEKAYLVNMEGLIQFLQRKVAEDHECLGCGKVKGSLFAVQTHMRDTGHCKIRFDTEQEQLAIGDYYDFRSTYSDGEDDDESDSGLPEDDAGGAKLGARRKPKSTGPDGKELKNGEEADGWETDSSTSSLDSAELTAVPAEGHHHQFERLEKHPHHSTRDPRPHHQADGWHSRAHKHTHTAFYDDYELHLPTGKSVGHRSHNKYFRQNLANYPTAEEREQLAITNSHSEQDGGNGEDQVAVARGRGRAGREIVPRGALGMSGVTDEKKRLARKDQERGRDLEQFRTKRTDYSYSTKLNNQKTYYYRYDGGG